MSASLEAIFALGDADLYRDPPKDGPAAPAWPDVGEKSKRPLKTYRNARAAIMALNIKCRHDLFHQRKLINGEELSDAACSMLRQTIIDDFEFDPGKAHTNDAVENLCWESSFDPVLNYLDGLKWDDVPRLDTWLIDFLGAEDTALNREISKLILVAAVRRARKPGAKFDHIMVLEGPEGAMKSMAIVKLFGEQNFSDQTILSVGDREQQELVAGVWGYEIGELNGMSRAEVEKIKAFVTRTHDRARGAYQRHRTDAPRRCIFIATTNDDKYLKSQTGNRRFWPVKVGKINIDRLIKERDVLWAEASTIEATSIPVVLPQDLWAAATAEQNERLEVDPWEDPLADVRGSVFWCDAITSATGQKFPPGDYEWVQSDALAVGTLGMPRDRMNGSTWKRLNYIMRKSGWNEGRHRFGGVRPVRGYFRNPP
jgi:hypothetical protein